MDLSNLKAPEPNKKKAKRIGRGQGSGRGGHTVGKGHNGQRSRSGFKEKFWFEGGQMPLQRKVPKWGFNNKFRKEYVAVNTGTIQLFVEHGKLEENITLEDLRNAGLAGKNDLVKLLGDGDIEASIDIEVHNASKSAQEKVEEAGGSITFVENNK
ncbi:50S ribosomal protein L15 [Aliifodinibius salipaludis]|uniref:Large ribosomal subunit protein uL15 n=1 Tax=Fodinibius salipaludis TaxID=2032627 RepID=A0A2A2G5W0_9BACT|nr:50S ribosomal protein L15 [Aliifodinibius salipaludis]PAU92688.1 50S ribosomal protein L15 [Aliifodinibius salipaludis]